MTTVTARAEVRPDGSVHLELPTTLPAGPVEAVVVLQPLSKSERPDRGARSGLFAGLGKDLDLDKALREIRTEWEGRQLT